MMMTYVYLNNFLLVCY